MTSEPLLAVDGEISRALTNACCQFHARTFNNPD